MLFGRFLLAYQWPQTMNGPSTEWLRGSKLCTYRGMKVYSLPFVKYLFKFSIGNYHLAWSIPMADPTYVIPGAAIHSFLMFAPFFALYEKKGMIIQGIFLFVFGPYLAGLITPNLMEQASIWCFFSIAQISIMLFCIRETLIINWGRNSSGHASLISGKKIGDIKQKGINDENIIEQDKKQRKLA